jgi:transcriptional regulator with XRE-family HTH domain
MTLDVARDQRAIIDELSFLRRKQQVSLESIGFLLGSDPGQISRYLKGTSRTTLTNYLRIARALGYRSRLVLEKADLGENASSGLQNLRVASRRVAKGGRPG